MYAEIMFNIKPTDETQIDPMPEIHQENVS